jgi:phage antirepressor YoqD-like protein
MPVKVINQVEGAAMLQAYESGDLPPADEVKLFKWLVESGMMAGLGDRYKARLKQLVDKGAITMVELEAED